MSIDSSKERHFSEEIPAVLADQRLDRVVAMIADISRTFASELVADSQVKVNSAYITKPSQKLLEGDVVEFSFTAKDLTPQPEPEVDVEVAFESDDFIVVNKRAGQVVHPGSGNNTGTILNGLLARYPEIALVGQVYRPGIVHRLDKETSGLLVVARTQRAYDSLTDQLRRRTVSRIYTALAEGSMSNARGKIDAPIGRSNKDPTKQALAAEGKTAVTHYEVVRNFGTHTLLNCRLETGRTHQIRVHLSSIGHPVVGDKKYDATTALDLASIFLHATKLSFNHPSDGSMQHFSADLPNNLSRHLKTISEESN